MWLPDYILLLNKFGGRLISTEKTTLLSIPSITWEHFLLLSTKHLSSRTRVTTCFLNLFLSKLDQFPPRKVLELLQINAVSVDPLILSALAHKAVAFLSTQPGEASSEIAEWKKIISSLDRTPRETLKPLFSQLPFPPKLDPDFKAAGLAYCGFEYAPEKYCQRRNEA